jgi:hypothetical protein
MSNKHGLQVHRKIVAAAQRLAQDTRTNKSVRKSRQKHWEDALRKQKQLEMQLNLLRHGDSQPDLSSA